MPLHHFSHRTDKENDCEVVEKVLYKVFDNVPPTITCDECGKPLTKELGCGFILKGSGWERDGYVTGR